MAVQELALTADAWTDVTTGLSLITGERYVLQAGPYPQDIHPPGVILVEASTAPTDFNVPYVYIVPNDTWEIEVGSETFYAASLSKAGKLTVAGSF